MSLIQPKLNIDEPTTQQVGRIGEILAAYYLELYGVQTEIVRSVGCDLWCSTEDGFMFTCEVKTCTVPMLFKGTWTTPRYHFGTGSKQQRSADIHAFVALDIQSVKFVASDGLGSATIKTYQEKHFNNSLIFSDLDNCIAALKKNKAA